MYISDGNKKMSFATWSLPAQKTCPGCTAQCSAKCYAKKAERQYKTAMASRVQNLTDSQSELFVGAMISEIIKSKAVKKYGMFRIHESGDFYSQEYLNKWIAICKKLPNVTFLAFTKSFQLDFSECPKNMQIVWSVWPDTDMNALPKTGKYSYAGDCVPADKIVIECVGHCDNCGICWQLDANKHIDGVHFEIH
jgi:hypothetical protein